MTYKRIVNNDVEGFCDSLHGCKCKITACFYGDPCLCDEKKDGWPLGTTFNEAGGAYYVVYLTLNLLCLVTFKQHDCSSQLNVQNSLCVIKLINDV